MLVFILGDEFKRTHATQHILLSGFRAGKVYYRIVFGRRFGQAGQHRKFGQTEFAHRFAEVSTRGSFKAISALPEINLIDIKLENLVLGEIAFDLDGQHGLGQFARKSFFIRQKKIARHLHGDSRGSLFGAAGEQIRTDSAQDTYCIHAPMAIETLVFSRDNGIAHMLGHFIDRHERASFFPEFCDQGAIACIDAEGLSGFVVG